MISDVNWISLGSPEVMTTKKSYSESLLKTASPFQKLWPRLMLASFPGCPVGLWQEKAVLPGHSFGERDIGEPQVL